jgi:hypothetical protein
MPGVSCGMSRRRHGAPVRYRRPYRRRGCSWGGGRGCCRPGRSASRCAAPGVATAQGVVLSGSGTSWTGTEAPVPANAAPNPGVLLGYIACPSTTQCVATGTYLDTSGKQQILVLTGSGTSWTAVEVPLPANTSSYPQVQLAPLACPSISACVTGGAYDSSGIMHAVLLAGSGTSWTLSEAPLPGDAATTGQVAGVSDVACPSATECVATGFYLDTSGQSQGMLLTGSGSTWTAARAPVPANGSASLPAGPYALACPSVSACIAGGEYETSSAGSSRGLLLTGPGPWTAIEAPLPGGAAVNTGLVHSVACASTSACAALGIYVDASDQSQLMLLTGPG